MWKLSHRCVRLIFESHVLYDISLRGILKQVGLINEAVVFEHVKTFAVCHTTTTDSLMPIPTIISNNLVDEAEGLHVALCGVYSVILYSYRTYFTITRAMFIRPDRRRFLTLFHYTRGDLILAASLR